MPHAGEAGRDVRAARVVCATARGPSKLSAAPSVSPRGETDEEVPSVARRAAPRARRASVSRPPARAGVRVTANMSRRDDAAIHAARACDTRGSARREMTVGALRNDGNRAPLTRRSGDDGACACPVCAEAPYTWSGFFCERAFSKFRGFPSFSCRFLDCNFN